MFSFNMSVEAVLHADAGVWRLSTGVHVVAHALAMWACSVLRALVPADNDASNICFDTLHQCLMSSML